MQVISSGEIIKVKADNLQAPKLAEEQAAEDEALQPTIFREKVTDKHTQVGRKYAVSAQALSALLAVPGKRRLGTDSRTCQWEPECSSIRGG
eukprot:3020875-Amphidinium_carterae.1